jgi:hypothetical protein
MISFKFIITAIYDSSRNILSISVIFPSWENIDRNYLPDFTDFAYRVDPSCDMGSNLITEFQG